MSARSRSGAIGIYHHCHNRFARRAFLCGYDHVSERVIEHRKEWIRRRIELLASVFAIEIFVFAPMDNQIHLILRNRPDIGEGWCNRQLALRSWRLCRTRHNKHGEAADNPYSCELNAWLGAPTKAEECQHVGDFDRPILLSTSAFASSLTLGLPIHQALLRIGFVR
jgi:hypothetical protein